MWVNTCQCVQGTIFKNCLETYRNFIRSMHLNIIFKLCFQQNEMTLKIFSTYKTEKNILIVEGDGHLLGLSNNTFLASKLLPKLSSLDNGIAMQTFLITQNESYYITLHASWLI